MKFNFDRKPDKSPEEQEFDLVNEQYEATFGKPFVFSIGMDGYTLPEAIETMRECIRTGKPQKQPDYDPELIY